MIKDKPMQGPQRHTKIGLGHLLDLQCQGHHLPNAEPEAREQDEAKGMEMRAEEGEDHHHIN